MPQWKKALRCGTFTELLFRRYLGEMILNPGILQIRLCMYTGLSLFLGALFFNLDTDYEDTQSINSHAALLFYSSSFYIFMVCVTIPFLAIDLQIRNKEVMNGLYHPLTHYMAIMIRTIPGCLILALVISVIQVNMVGHQNGIQFFLILTLALWCADALALLVSLCAPHFVIGIVVCAAVCGVFMALEGFMLQPSQFPLWLHWLYPVPFHTYVFSGLMANEFQGQPFGEEVLVSYEIEHTSIGRCLLVLFCYGLSIHFLGILTVLLSRRIDKKVKDS
jgi:ABC-type multidrug transport system permease subunit